MSRKGISNKYSRKILTYCKICKKQILVYPSRLKIGKGKFCSQKCSAQDRIEGLKKRSIGNIWGSLRIIDIDYRKKMSALMKGKSRPNIAKSKIGNKNPNWRGGVTPLNKRIRNSAKFANWRKKVFIRDNFTCQICKQRGGELHPDHIKQFAYYPKLRFKLSNGRTLCKGCHMKTSTWGFKKLPSEQK